MQDNALSVFLSRLDFAWITTMHILHPPLTIGLAGLLFLVLAEWRWVHSNDERWYRLVRFFERLFIVNSPPVSPPGITMEMALGILYGPFSQAAGPFFGQVLGYETITAFMYEAGFTGLTIFGWGKISKRMHLFATFNVALSSALSAMWILDANSWMQTPAGVVLKNGFFQVVDWGMALFRPIGYLVVLSLRSMATADAANLCWPCSGRPPLPHPRHSSVSTRLWSAVPLASSAKTTRESSGAGRRPYAPPKACRSLPSTCG